MDYSTDLYWIAQRQPIHRVDDFVYIGKYTAATDPELLLSYNIKNVVQIQAQDIPGFFQDVFQYHRITIQDHQDQNIIQHIPACLAFIFSSIKEEKSVFVHCNAGISRSGSIIIAYLMVKHQIQFQQAWKMARQARPCIQPNEGFQEQLKNFNYQSFEELKQVKQRINCLILH